MQQDVAAGFYTISVLEGGEGALDPLSTATMEQARFFCFVCWLVFRNHLSEGRRVLGFPQAYCCCKDVAAREVWLVDGVLHHHI